MTSIEKIRPINSLVIVEDSNGGEVPPWEDGKLILASRSAIFVGCYPEPDGPTEIMIGPANEIGPNLDPLFDGQLETPSTIVVVSSVDRKTFLSEKVSEARTRVRIWPNHDKWPDKIIIGLD